MTNKRSFTIYCVVAGVLLLGALVWSAPSKSATTTDLGPEPSKPFFLAYDAPADAFADVRATFDAPAGKHGPIRVRDGHFAFADTGRVRFWATNLSGDAGLPPKDAAARIADRLAKYGFNLVRFHGLDGFGQSIFDRRQGDTRHFDPAKLDLLDNIVAELEKRGVYVNINLHVGRRFTKADGVAEADWLAYSKYCVIFDPRMIELQKEYARNLLTHRNPYTGKTYAEDPAVIIIEMTNENSLLGGWTNGQLRGEQRAKPGNAWTDIPPFYGEELTRFYNQWLAKRYGSRAALEKAWGNGARKAGSQMLVNGDFSDAKKAWSFSARQPSASATMDVVREDGRSCVKIVTTKTDGTPWYVMLTQSGLRIRKGEKYAVSYRLKSDSPRKIGAEVAHFGPDPYRGYGSKSAAATSDWSEQRYTFVAPEDDDSVRLSFHFGEATGTVWLGDVRMAEAAIDGLRNGEDPAQGTVRRLAPEEFGSVTAARFRDEGRFLYETEMAYYRQMDDLLKKELKVQALVEGTNHNYGLPCLRAESSLDLVDCHSYWQHPRFPNRPWSVTDWNIGNTAMLDAPQQNTIAGLCRSSFAGKPFTVSEYNHPYPNEYACESPLLMAAYGALQDWDAIYFYTFAHQWTERELNGDRVTGYFDVCNQVAQMAQMPTASLLFRRGDVQAAKRLVAIQYDERRVFDSLRDTPRDNLFRLEQPLSPLLPLVHRVRVAKYDAPQSTRVEDLGFAAPKEKILSDTGELLWQAEGKGKNYMTIDTPLTRGAIGWIGGRMIETAGLRCEVATPFCAVSATSLDGKPLQASGKILVAAVARCANTGMKWNDARNSINNNWGGPPLLIQPVEGRVVLKRDQGAAPLRIVPLDSSGKPLGAPQSLGTGDSVTIRLSSDPATVWYALTAAR